MDSIFNQRVYGSEFYQQIQSIGKELKKMDLGISKIKNETGYKFVNRLIQTYSALGKTKDLIKLFSTFKK